jgi:hypothetical protein
MIVSLFLAWAAGHLSAYVILFSIGKKRVHLGVRILATILMSIVALVLGTAIYEEYLYEALMRFDLDGDGLIDSTEKSAKQEEIEIELSSDTSRRMALLVSPIAFGILCISEALLTRACVYLIKTR